MYYTNVRKTNVLLFQLAEAYLITSRQSNSMYHRAQLIQVYSTHSVTCKGTHVARRRYNMGTKVVKADICGHAEKERGN